MSERHLEGMSSDGYITCQNFFGAFPYRTVTSDRNGCGWIAAFNLRRALGEELDFNEVREEMDTLHTWRFPGPTLMKNMRHYLSKYVPGYELTTGKTAATKAAAASRAGIFRYTESGVPHFVCFIRQNDGNFRFLNVDDTPNGDDFIESMEDFAKKHFRVGTVTAITVR